MHKRLSMPKPIVSVVLFAAAPKTSDVHVSIRVGAMARIGNLGKLSVANLATAAFTQKLDAMRQRSPICITWDSHKSLL